MEKNNCQNCNTQLKAGVFSSVEIIKGKNAKLINLYNLGEAESYCSKCGTKILANAKELLISEKSNINIKMQSISKYIPIISISSPAGWEYEVIDLITAQSTSGTGFASELSESFNDFWGTQSKTINNKLRLGENICKDQLRIRCITEGGNAVVGVDIDYSEIGAQKGLLMICMAGTAIKLKDITVFDMERQNALQEIAVLRDRINLLSEFD